MFHILFMFFVLIMLNLRLLTFRVRYLFSIIIKIERLQVLLSYTWVGYTIGDSVPADFISIRPSIFNTRPVAPTINR